MRLPRAQEIEDAEILGQLYGLIDHPLLLIVVPHFDISRQREIFAQRMPLKAIIRQQTAQVRMVGEEDAVHIPALRAQTIGRGEHVRDSRDRRILVGADLHANTMVLA